MIDINFFTRRAPDANRTTDSNKSTVAAPRTIANGTIRPTATNGCSDRTQELPRLNGSELHITFRGVVYPWQLDHMNHMNVQHYMATFDQASWVLLALLGLDSWYFQRNRRAMAALEQTIEYKSELRAGEAFEIRSTVLEVRDKTIRMRHDMHRVRTGGLAASTTILGVHIDSEARRGMPLPTDVVDRAQFLNASILHSGADSAWSQTCEVG
jgi:acyl-CoA thioester hydrolase